MNNEADYCHHCGGYHPDRCPYEPRILWPVLLYVGLIAAIVVGSLAAWHWLPK